MSETIFSSLGSTTPSPTKKKNLSESSAFNPAENTIFNLKFQLN
jgi:hypothetical protein